MVPGIMVSGLGKRTLTLMAKRKLFGVAMVEAEILFDSYYCSVLLASA